VYSGKKIMRNTNELAYRVSETQLLQNLKTWSLHSSDSDKFMVIAGWFREFYMGFLRIYADGSMKNI
jgi:hypothetical protein